MLCSDPRPHARTGDRPGDNVPASPMEGRLAPEALITVERNRQSAQRAARDTAEFWFIRASARRLGYGQREAASREAGIGNPRTTVSYVAYSDTRLIVDESALSRRVRSYYGKKHNIHRTLSRDGPAPSGPSVPVRDARHGMSLVGKRRRTLHEGERGTGVLTVASDLRERARTAVGAGIERESTGGGGLLPSRKRKRARAPASSQQPPRYRPRHPQLHPFDGCTRAIRFQSRRTV